MIELLHYSLAQSTETDVQGPILRTVASSDSYRRGSAGCVMHKYCWIALITAWCYTVAVFIIIMLVCSYPLLLNNALASKELHGNTIPHV